MHGRAPPATSGSIDLQQQAGWSRRPGCQGSGDYAATGDIVYVQHGRLSGEPFRSRCACRCAVSPFRSPTALTRRCLPMESVTFGLARARCVGGAGPRRGAEFEMVWVDRAGGRLRSTRRGVFSITFLCQRESRLVALARRIASRASGWRHDAGDNIWVKELPRGPAVPGVVRCRTPIFALDGPPTAARSCSLPFAPSPASIMHRADGAGKDSLLLSGVIDEAALSPNGKWLVFREGSSDAGPGGRDIKGMRLGSRHGARVRDHDVVRRRSDRAVAQWAVDRLSVGRDGTNGSVRSLVSKHRLVETTSLEWRRARLRSGRTMVASCST